MAMEEIKLTQNVHNEALSADVPDKKKAGKFQPFKKLFSKRRKKDATSSREVSAGRSRRPPCVSNGTVSSDDETLEDNLRSFNYSMGTRAFSHDSIFIPDGGAESEQTVQAMSQDNIVGKVKTLQRQLGKNIKFGQPPPQAVPMKKADSGDASLEEDLFLTSPIEIVTHQDVILCDSEHQPSDTYSSLSPLNQPAARSEMEEKVTPAKPSRPKRHFSSAGTIESVNLDAIPRAIARLDNSAARHKLAVKPKHQRVSKRHRRLAGDPLGEHGGLPQPLSLDQNGHSGEDKLVWHEEEPEPLDAEDKRRHEEYWRELEAKCKRQKAEAAEKRRLEEQRLQALERRLWEESRQPALLAEGPEDLPGEEEQETPLEKPRGTAWPEPGEDRLPEEETHVKERRQLQQALEARNRQEAEKQRQEEEEREQERWRKREEERRQEELEEQRRQEEEERVRELRRQEEERMEELRRQEEEERMKELRRQEEEERMKEQERMEELRRQEEEERMKEQERMEELRRQEEERMKELRRQEEEERMKELRRQEEEEERMKEQEKMEELRRQEEERMKELRRQEEEEERMKEQEKMEELRRQEEEEEEERMKELRRQEEEEERKRKEALRKQAEMEALRRPEAEKKVREEEGSLQLAHQRGLRSPRRRKDFAEKADGPQPAPQPGDGEEARRGEKPQPQPPEAPPGERRQGKREGTRAQRPQKPDAPSEEPPRAPAARSGEELRWREVDERQSTPRPYTFQVSSGGKQILFPKVNLSPVTPLKEAGAGPAPAPPPEPQPPRAGAAPPGLPSALSVPHTAILVTGAQLCGPAVNLSQIKDSACRSLLGLAEDRRPAEGAAAERAGRPRPPAPDAPGGEGALAELMSIRSRILRSAEGEPRPGDREPPGPEGGDEPAAAPRRTPSMGAKFCIKPAWQKFADGGGADGEGGRRRAAGDARERGGPPREPADATDGCQFAKDLPSFLVPGLPSPPPPPPPPPPQVAAHAEPGSGPDGGGRKAEPAGAGGEEKASPFGIKLRRTNYSLRFHSDQQAEQKRKKRPGSGGDGAGGDKDAAARPGPALAAAPTESAPGPAAPPPPAQPAPPPASSRSPTPEHRPPPKMPTVQKPALAPKPSSQTPPPSPLSKLSRPYLAELLSRRPGKPDAEPGEPSKEPGPRAAPSGCPPPPPEEERGPERKPGSPAPPAGRREKPSPSPEPERREKPVLQSRHSLDGSRLADKGEPAQPLWITLALQKQKGFREQQATREERKQAREARQAEKLSKEVSISRAGSLHKPVTQPEAQKPQKPEEPKPDTAASRLERREHLKKANTLPTSVTVEISDSAPPAPLVKEVTKRLSTPDAAPVSTEPAWLALAKRKAKAWSDCPQIIK